MDIEKLIKALTDLSKSKEIYEKLINQKIENYIKTGIYKYPYSEWMEVDKKMIRNMIRYQIDHSFKQALNLLQDIKSS